MLDLVLLDVDGTLVGSSGFVKDCVWQATDKALEQGLVMSVCTGRPGSGIAQKIAERIGPKHPHIFQNGAVISFPNGDPLKVYGLKEAQSSQLIEFARDNNLSLEIYTPHELFVEKHTDLTERHHRMLGVNAIVRDLEDVIENEPVVRAQWVIPTGAYEKTMALEVEGVDYNSATSPAVEGVTFISITQSGVSKGSALHELAKHFGTTAENVMAVGDSTGDEPMLVVAGHPRAMENSPAELTDKYPVLPNVEECGIVTAISEALNYEAANDSDAKQDNKGNTSDN